MPYLEIAVDELVALRQDGLFEAWRGALGEALRRAAQLEDDDVIDPEGARLTEIRQSLLDASRSAVVDTRRSRVLRSSSIGAASFAVGCATGALGAVGGVDMAAAAGGLGALAALAINWLGGRPTSGQRKFRRFVSQLFPLE